MFNDNSLDPRLFRSCLHGAGIADKYLCLERGTAFTYFASQVRS
jgi:hypothetical protein